MEKPAIAVHRPASLDECRIHEFITLARSGGEVGGAVLSDRVRKAEVLVFACLAGQVQAIAALKNPLASYRRRISTKAHHPLDVWLYPFELGYVYVLPSARGRGYSVLVASAALAASVGKGVFATSRSDNVAMHRTLQRFNFEPTGRLYASPRGVHQIQLFSRNGA